MKTQKNQIRSVIVLIISLVMLSSVAFAVDTFVVEETEEVSLDVTARDPDQDSIEYIYSNPLNKDGKWQTNYDDAGEYLVDITATDGQHNATQTIKIIVTNKNRAPTIMKKSISFKEGDVIDLTKFVVDPDEDILQYQFNSPFDRNGKWYTGYSDAGRYAVDFIVNDGDFYQKERMEIIIEETNQAPKIISLFSDKGRVLTKEGDVFEFNAKAKDFDGDNVEYNWYIDNSFIGNENSGEFYFNYEKEGEHILKLVVKDQELETSREWIIDVTNTNREPSISDLSFSVYETEKVILNLPRTDLDGDQLTYSLDPLFTDNKAWNTSFYDAGNYTFEGIANDGEYKTSFFISVEILELDQAPIVNIPELIEAFEGEEFVWDLDINDPDNDEITVEINGMPKEVMFNSEDNQVSWDVPYSFIQRRDSPITNALNMMGIEQVFLSKRDLPIEITVCGLRICSKEKTTLRVHNTNRAPYFVEFYDQYAFETDSVKPYVKAVDPDGDIIRYSFGAPFNKNGVWDTDFSDAGEFVVPITVSDWSLSENQEISVVVQEKNRAPEFKIKNKKVSVFEGEQVIINFESSDLDGDFLMLTVNDEIANSEFNGSFVWTPEFNTVSSEEKSKDLTLSFSVSDGVETITKEAKVIVKDVNRAPMITESTPQEDVVYSFTNSPVEFSVDVTELDQSDSLTFEWEFSGLDFNTVKDTDSITRTFKSPGKKTVQVTVSDGENVVEKKWTVLVSSTQSEPTVALDSTQKTVQENSVEKAPNQHTYTVYRITNW